jgi:hypothetical protein
MTNFPSDDKNLKFLDFWEIWLLLANFSLFRFFLKKSLDFLEKILDFLENFGFLGNFWIF